ncbi:MAG: hypothetical protein HDT28_06510 [Clostridiales bacterium]|nr:hypothetical protein [Clostridiales bacterium]
MDGYEIKKKLGYPKTVFYEEGIVLTYKDGHEVTIRASEIDRIEYVKPSLLSYIMASPLFGGTYPGRMEIRMFGNYCNSLLNRVSNTSLYLIKISYKEIFKLPEIYKQKMGLPQY